MGAPKGNKHAVGNKGGRPRKYDLELEAKELLDFSLKDECLSLEDFTNLKEYCASDLSRFASESLEFCEALKKAKERIGNRREKKANTNEMNYGVWSRSARLYQIPLSLSEDQVKENELERKMRLVEYEMKLKSKIDSNVTENILSQFNDLMHQLSGLQSSRKIDENKIREETKS